MYRELLYHLQAGHLKEHLIDTIQPEEIRGGGLLKYARLLSSGYKPLYPTKLARMERYMCSRFFIDFPDIDKQGAYRTCSSIYRTRIGIGLTRGYFR